MTDGLTYRRTEGLTGVGLFSLYIYNEQIVQYDGSIHNREGYSLGPLLRGPILLEDTVTASALNYNSDRGHTITSNYIELHQIT